MLMDSLTCLSILACPQCSGELRQARAELICGRCGTVGKWVEGLPCFSDPSYYWGEVSREEMNQVLRLASDVGWEVAVERVIQESSLRRYICDPRRADFQFLWNLPPTASVLDIGAGWGAISSELGRRFARVVAVEGVLERARFIRTRMEQLRRQNVVVVCADFLRLPLAPHQFDAVVLNGVLEWVGMNSTAGDPRHLQVSFLRRIRDLLKPSGSLCLGIENRIGLAMLRGAPDHSGLRYTSLMPRWAADRWCRWFGRRRRSPANVGYRTYTYSLPGYRRLMAEAGFPQLQAFHAWDGYNNPSVLIPLDDPEVLRYFLDSLDLRQEGWRGRFKHRLLKWAAGCGLWRNLASDFVLFVEKG